VRGIAVSGSVLLLSTSRGLYRTTDGAAHWQQLAGNLPAHLEAAPLIMSDPPDSGSWYAGFSIVPYDELWRTGGSSKNSLTRLKLVNLLPAAAFLALFALASGLALRRLRRYYRSESGVTRIL
jgi:hypothetical protein